MNREIIFRGKHIHALPGNEHLDGRWIEGYLCDKNYINSPELEGEFLVDKNTICQYTGLTDKNGRKVFEGDIVKYGNSTHKVVFENRFGTAYFGIVFEDRGEVWSFGHTCSTLNMTIIGNIFDNPELVKMKSGIWR